MWFIDHLSTDLKTVSVKAGFRYSRCWYDLCINAFMLISKKSTVFSSKDVEFQIHF